MDVLIPALPTCGRRLRPDGKEKDSSWQESACERGAVLFLLLREQINPSLFPITSESSYLCAGKDSPVKQSSDFSGFLQGEYFHGVRAPVISFYL